MKRVYDELQTIYERVMKGKSIPEPVKMKLKAIHANLDKVQLKNERDKLLRKLFRN